MADISTISTEELLKLRGSPKKPEDAVESLNALTAPIALGQGEQAQAIDEAPVVSQKQGGIQDVSTEALRSQRDQFTQGQADQDEITQLFEQLGGKSPSGRPLPIRTVSAGMAGSIENPQFAKEVSRREAFSGLTEKGFTPEAINQTLKAQKMLGGARTGRAVGGFGGALAGTAVLGRVIPGPLDDIAILATLASGVGAGVGGVAGEAVQTGIEEKRLISGREMLKAFSIEAGTEVGARTVVGLGKTVLSPFIKKTVPEAAALVDDFAKVGGQFSPTELDRRFSLRVGESFARGGFGTEDIFQEFEEKQGKAVLAFADSIIESIGEGVARQTPEEVGEIFAKGISKPNGRIFTIFDELIDPLYRQLDELAPDATVATRSLKKFAKKHLATDLRVKGQFLSPTGKAKLTSILELDETLSFSDMRTLKSSFMRDARKLARDVDQSQGIIKQLAGIADDAVFDPGATKNLSQEALTLWENTRNLYKAGQEGIKSTFSETLAKRILKNPSNVVKEVFPNNNPKAIRALRQSLVRPTGGPIVRNGKVIAKVGGKISPEGKQLWNQLRQAWLAEAVDQASKEGVAKPKVFNNILRKFSPESLKEMFPEKELSKRVKNIQSVFNIAGRKPPTGAALFSRGAQVGGLAMLYRGAKEGIGLGITAGGLLAIGPDAFARLSTNPKGIKLLTAGFRMKPGATGLVPNAVRMVRLLKEMDRKENKVRLSAVRRKRSEEIGRQLTGTTP